MIWHKTVGKYIATGNDIMPYFIKKKYIIIRLEENLLLIITPVINMV